MSRYQQQIDQSFTTHLLSPKQAEQTEAIRAKARELAQFIADTCPESRETSLALTKLDEVSMAANAAIARHGGE
jgi:hypothetical protein